MSDSFERGSLRTKRRGVRLSPLWPSPVICLLLLVTGSFCVSPCLAGWPLDESISSSSRSQLKIGVTKRQPWLQRFLPSQRQRQAVAPPPRFVPLLPSESNKTTEKMSEELVGDETSKEKLEGMDPYATMERRSSKPSAVSPLSSLFAGALPSLLKDPVRLGRSLLENPEKLGRWSAAGLQVSLVFYLIHAVWKAAAEVVEEYSQELAGTDPSYLKRDDVARVLAFFEQDPQAAATAIQAHERGKASSTALPSLGVLQMAQTLVVSGLPLRSEPAAAGKATPSVESVLLGLTRSEAALMQQCLWAPQPSQTNTEALRSSWNNIAGLEIAKERLLSSLATVKGRYSQMYAPLFDNSNTASGVLLYGPPGCGKTMLVKALASTARLPCLVITPSLLLRKYVGETNLQVRSLFSLANKLAPCVLCIDELDGLFRERSESEHEVSRDLKTEFLQWWDGMLSSPTSDKKQILVIGATNRPFDVDSAVLRRLPQSQFVGLPDQNARVLLLKQLLRTVPTDANLNVERIAVMSENYSPSDLRQLLQTAALTGPLREISHLQMRAPRNPRCLTTNDVLRAFQQVPPTPMSNQYRAALSNFARIPSFPCPVGEIESNWGNFYNAGTLQLDPVSYDQFTDVVNKTDEEASDALDEEEPSDEDIG